MKILVLKNAKKELMKKKHKKFCTDLNDIKHFLILPSVVIGCVSFLALAFRLSIPATITSSVVRIKNCATTAGIKKYKSIIKKKEKIHDKEVYSSFKDNIWGSDTYRICN